LDSDEWHDDRGSRTARIRLYGPNAIRNQKIHRIKTTEDFDPVLTFGKLASAASVYRVKLADAWVHPNVDFIEQHQAVAKILRPHLEEARRVTQPHSMRSRLFYESSWKPQRAFRSSFRQWFSS
jgi:hypothetical protein